MFELGNMERADWQLLRDGAVTLFWNKDIFHKAMNSLRDLDYRILELPYETMPKFCESVSNSLKWKQQFGYTPWTGNLDALNDGIRGEPSASSDDTAICLSGFHNMVRDDSEWATALLDILEYQSRNYLLFGQRLIILVQTDNPNYQCKKIGGRQVQWNHEEWFDKSRGI